MRDPIRSSWPRLVLTVFLASTALPAGARSIAVSPGAADRFGLVTDSCPTFSWSSAPGALAYELAVYSLNDEVVGSAASMESQLDTPVLAKSILANATTWTPDGESCLPDAGRFGWIVRARTADGEWSEWSAPLLFESSGGPRSREVERALAVFEQGLAEDPILLQRPLGGDSAPTVLEERPNPAARRADPRSSPESALVFLPADSLAIGGSYGFTETRDVVRWVPANEFVPISNAAGFPSFTRENGILRWTSAPAVGTFVGEVRIPPNAQIVGASCSYVDNEPGGDQQIAFVLRRAGGGFSAASISFGSQTSSGAAVGDQQVNGSALDQTLFGTTWSVWFKVTLTQSVSSSELSFRGCSAILRFDELSP